MLQQAEAARAEQKKCCQQQSSGKLEESKPTTTRSSGFGVIVALANLWMNRARHDTTTSCVSERRRRAHFLNSLDYKSRRVGEITN